MTPKQREQLKTFEELGFNIRKLNYEDLVEELLHKYIEVSMALDYTNEQTFEKELLRVTRTKTN